MEPGSQLVWKGCARPRQACGVVGHLYRQKLAPQRSCCRTRRALAGGRSATSQPCARALERRLTGLMPVLLLCDSRSAVARAAVCTDNRHHRKPVVGARSPSRRAGHQGSITPSWPHPRRLPARVRARACADPAREHVHSQHDSTWSLTISQKPQIRFA